MSDMTTAEPVRTVQDQRPEPPSVFPERFTITSWLWIAGTIPSKWVPFVHGDYESEYEAASAAQKRIDQGHRSVRIVRIPGDAAGGGQQ